MLAAVCRLQLLYSLRRVGILFVTKDYGYTYLLHDVMRFI